MLQEVERMFQKPDFVKILKIGAGAGIAIALAQAMGLEFSTSAGVITLLSIQDTKKETIRVIVLRLCSFCIAIALSAACFSLLGYGALAIGVFLLFFSGASFVLGMQEGIAVNTVLMTHFMSEQSMSIPQVGNELAILVVGAGMGLLLNLYIPGKEKQIRAGQEAVENRMKGILKDMQGLLLASLQPSPDSLRNSLAELDRELKKGEKHAFEEMENKLLSETSYYLHYMNMRRMQSGILGRIGENICHLQIFPAQSDQIARLIGQISDSFHEYNNALELLMELEGVKESIRKQALPDTRREFESRAVLYQILLELESFLEIKKNFVEELRESDIKKFWKNTGFNPLGLKNQKYRT